MKLNREGKSLMQRFLTLCLSLLVAGLATGSYTFGALLYLDTFTKPVNTALSSSIPDISNGSVYTATSGTGTNDLKIIGTKVALTTNGQDAYAGLAALIPNTPGNVIRTSMDINLSAAQANGDYFAHLGQSNGSAFYQRLFAKSTTGGYLLGLVDTSGGTTTYGTTVLSLGTTYHVDIDWTNVAGDKNDTFVLAVDNANYLNYAWAAADPTEPTFINSAHMRQGASGSSATLTIDNYSVDSPIFIPEPATFVLAGLASVFCLAQRRRQ
jgi:hypothetical protein